MRRALRAFALGLALGFAGSAEGAARAEAPKEAGRVVVVEVDPRATRIDARELRAAVAMELGAAAVAPDDVQAPRASGTIVVALKGSALVVSYREHGAPITRAIDAPDEPEAMVRAAVALAGNLARDEAGELLQELRNGKNGGPAALQPPASAMSGDAGTDDSELRRDRLGAVLAYHTEDRRTLRTVLGWSIVGAALVAEGVGAYLAIHDHNDVGMVLLFGSETAVPLGLTLLPNAKLDEIRTYYEHDRATGRPAEAVVDDVEDRWLREARSERSLRTFAGWADLVLGALVLACDGLLIADEAKTPNPSYGMAAGFMVSGGVAVGYGLHLLVTEGPVESSLHEYERASGHRVWGAGIRPRVSLLPGGFALGLGGGF
jgi:hypothetical protein